MAGMGGRDAGDQRRKLRLRSASAAPSACSTPCVRHHPGRILVILGIALAGDHQHQPVAAGCAAASKGTGCDARRPGSCHAGRCGASGSISPRRSWSSVAPLTPPGPGLRFCAARPLTCTLRPWTADSARTAARLVSQHSCSRTALRSSSLGSVRAFHGGMTENPSASPSFAASAIGQQHIKPARRLHRAGAGFGLRAKAEKDVAARRAPDGAAGILGHHQAMHRIGPIGGDIIPARPAHAGADQSPGWPAASGSRPACPRCPARHRPSGFSWKKTKPWSALHHALRPVGMGQQPGADGLQRDVLRAPARRRRSACGRWRYRAGRSRRHRRCAPMPPSSNTTRPDPESAGRKSATGSSAQNSIGALATPSARSRRGRR